MRRRSLISLSIAAISAVALLFAVFATAEAGERHPGSARDLTLSFDAEPAYSEWRSIQPGFKCVNGVRSRRTSKPPAAAFVRESSPGNVRHGSYSARVVLRPGDHASYTCAAEAVMAIEQLNEGEGSESWWGWSWKLPVGWRGAKSWGMLFELTVNASLWPSYGMLNFDAAKAGSLRLGLHTGLTPNPGSSSYDSAYEKWVTLLGSGSPRPMVYGKWLDFYMHVVWRSRTAGVLEIWYREDGQGGFTKLYSNVPGGGALIQAAPHPTLLYNTRNGAPGENGKPGLELEGGFYRKNAAWSNEYLWDGMRRRQSQAALLAEFPDAAAPAPPATAATTSTAPTSATSTAPTPAILSGTAAEPDISLSSDQEPYLSEWDSVQPGYRCVNGVVSGVNKSAGQAFVRDAAVKRHGPYSAHVYLRPGDYSADSCSKEAVYLIKRLTEGEGKEGWYGWSWRFPVGWPGAKWPGEIMALTTHHSYFPSYGQFSINASDANNLRLDLKTGRTPSPGAAAFDPIAPNGYQASEYLLGTSAPRPFTKGVWHDFAMHVVWRSRTNGVLTIWHREEGKSWEKLYDNTGSGDALIKRPPHPTLMYNDKYGAPGENGRPGLILQAGLSRTIQSNTADYWFDGFRRRQSQAALLAEFPS